MQVSQRGCQDLLLAQTPNGALQAAAVPARKDRGEDVYGVL